MALRLSTALVEDMLDTAPFKTAMNLCFIDIYTGSQPATANAATTGTLLVTISNNGTATGLTWGPSSTNGVINKTAAETWSGTAVATGTAGWFRVRLAADPNTLDAGSTYKRFDGSISTSGSDMNLGALTVTSGAPVVLSAGSFTLPTS